MHPPPSFFPPFPPPLPLPRRKPTEQSMPCEDFSRLQLFCSQLQIYFSAWYSCIVVKIFELQSSKQRCSVYREGRNLLVKGRKGFCLILLITSFPLCLLYTNHPLSLTEGKGTLNQSQFRKLEKISCQARSEGEKVPGRLCCKR